MGLFCFHVSSFYDWKCAFQLSAMFRYGAHKGLVSLYR